MADRRFASVIDSTRLFASRAVSPKTQPLRVEESLCNQALAQLNDLPFPDLGLSAYLAIITAREEEQTARAML